MNVIILIGVIFFILFATNFRVFI